MIYDYTVIKLARIILPQMFDNTHPKIILQPLITEESSFLYEQLNNVIYDSINKFGYTLGDYSEPTEKEMPRSSNAISPLVCDFRRVY